MRKKKLILIPAAAVCILLCIVLIKTSGSSDLPESLDDLLTIEPLDTYEMSEDGSEFYYDERHDKECKDRIVQRNYCEKGADGMLMVSIAAYKGKNVLLSCEEEYDRSWYSTWTHQHEISAADGHVIHIGMTRMEDYEDVIIRGWAEEGDYLFEFAMYNSDDFVTEQQKQDFEKMLRTVNFH